MQGAKISRRFERLEIGGNKIEVAITDRVTSSEEAPQDIVYYILCPYCGKDNLANADFCLSCGRQLNSEEITNYQAATHLLVKCKACGGMNLKERQNCWVCGIDLYTKKKKMYVPENSGNVISVNMDGKEYKSTDKDLPWDIRILMEKIRNEGYSKEVVDKWVQEKNIKTELRRDSTIHQINDIRSRMQFGTYRLIILLILGAAAFFMIRLNFTMPLKFLNAASSQLESNSK